MQVMIERGMVKIAIPGVGDFTLTRHGAERLGEMLVAVAGLLCQAEGTNAHYAKEGKDV